MISDIASELRKLHELSFTYFPHPDAQELKGRKHLSIKRNMASDPAFLRKFKKAYER
jgi:hypothetical protein